MSRTSHEALSSNIDYEISRDLFCRQASFKTPGSIVELSELCDLLERAPRSRCAISGKSSAYLPEIMRRNSPNCALKLTYTH